MTPLALPAPSPPDETRRAHYRLSTETWALILAEYVGGATAPELVLKWRVSIHGLRRRITRHKATKRDHGDAQAIAQAASREAARLRARAESPEARAARLFDEPEPDEDEAGDALALARLATLASGRAMKGRLWAEARALAGLAESYARLADRAGRRDGYGEEPDEAAFEAVRRKVLGMYGEEEGAEGEPEPAPSAS